LIPRPRLIAALALLLFLAAVAVAFPALSALLFGLDAMVLGIAAADAWRSQVAWTVDRRVDPLASIGRPFEVTLRIEHRGRRTVRFRVTDAAPGSAAGVPAEGLLEPRTPVELRYRVTVDERGSRSFGPVTVRWRTPWGLWERERSFALASMVQVYPDLLPLRSLLRTGVADERRAPVRVRRRPGGDNEFERLRPYVAGDTFRAIDWRATARRGDPVTREYRQEVNQNLIFLLDAGRLSSARLGRLSHFDHALNAALMLSHVALRHGDRVGMLVYDSRVRVWVPPMGGVRSGPRLTQQTLDLFPSWDEADHAAAFRFLGQKVRKRSLVIVLSSVLDDVNASLQEALVGGLAGRHVPVCVSMRDPALTELVKPAEGPYVSAAAAELWVWRSEALRRLRSRGALVIDTEPERLPSVLVSRYLQIKAERVL
jgi:uncharacterized protein (DUF58 family)